MLLLTNGTAGNKWMNTFQPGARFQDATGHIPGTITADGNGWADFRCLDRSVSVWLQV